MLKEFKDFIRRGNVIDLAVAVVLGVAFGAVVLSFVKDILMPPIGLLLGQVDFSNLFVNLSNQHYGSLSEAQQAGAPTINYGIFINTVINFLIIAFAVFLIVRLVNKGRPATTKVCPYCTSMIAVQATRCPHCTSELA
ncbi:MAG: large conductance mechanosensitive channel protein MscL [Armatimonadetes bacterium]|nr:large conductance mechanosensitive channel protein MscL [Armatimonadota bacterium]